jgi:hypothetical protein
VDCRPCSKGERGAIAETSSAGEGAEAYETKTKDDAKYKVEIERLRIELESLRNETELKLQTTNPAKNSWLCPLLQGVASGS